jgi:SpoVK/Ycf46/Vps4 family AAA+-type ATPase
MQVLTPAHHGAHVPCRSAQVSASQLTTGFVGQTGAKTREIFESARGAVLFIDEAYRLYDPLGRSYMQEAIDEIVTLLTEEAYKGKMVVIFAGYKGQMSEMLDKVKKMADSH